MISYFKTQWFNLVVSFLNLGLATYYATQEEWVAALCWFLYGCCWLIMSRVDYNHDRIKLLEKKAEKYDALCEEVHELYEANRIDREHIKLLEQKIRILEEKLR